MRLALVGLFTAAAFAPAAEAPVDARLKDLGVEMVLDTPGRVGACDVLRFTPDGQHLIAAGDDKVVRVWDCGPGGLTPAAVPVLRWSIFREHRGGIYAADIVPDPKNKDGFRVAVAGVGLRQSAAAVIDSRGKVVFGLPPFAPGEQEEQAKTLQAVWSIAFAPGGDRVALGGSDGSVWLWNLERKEVHFVGRHARGGGDRPGPLNEVRLVSFTDADHLLSVAADGRALQWDTTVDRPAPRELFRFQNVKNLACVAMDRTKKWLAAGGQTFAVGERSSLVELRSVDGSRRKTLALPGRNFPKYLSFDAASRRLAVGTYQTSQPPGFYLLLGGGTYLFDLGEDEPRATAGPSTSYYVDAVAFHPDGKRLAVSGGDDHDVALWDLSKPDRPVSLITGPGRGLWGVGVSKDFRYLGYRDRRTTGPAHPNELGTGDWHVFDLKERRFAAAAEAQAFKPAEPLKTADGWSVKPHPLDGTIWYVVKGGTEHKVPLTFLDKFPRCYTFLKADDDHPTRLVVGHIWGMSVFALGDGPPKLLRKFAGHQGEVMAVAPSADGKFLVSASRDQTVAIWSLLPQKNQDELGAAFEVNGDRLVVSAVAPGSPSWEARLEPGDRIKEFYYGGKKATGAPTDWLATLRNPTPGLACEFVLERGDGVLYSMTTTRQRPLARFFPMDNREWVLWRYYDFYYDCSANGDRFLAWQLSGDVDTTPRFDPLERYRKRFFKPEKVAALFNDLGNAPERVSLIDIEPPRIAFDASPDKVAPGEAVRISITARPSGEGMEQRLKQINLWVNGAMLQEWKVVDPKEPSFQTFYDLPAEQLRRGTNILTVQAYNQADIRHHVDARVDYQKPDAPSNLFALVVGVGDYTKTNEALRKLVAGRQLSTRPVVRDVLTNLSAGKDALAVEQLLSSQKKFFATTNVVTLRDKDASRERILDEIARMARQVRPDDTFVLFLGGHGASGQEINGIAKGRDVELSSKVPPHLFVFCTHDFALDKPLATGLPSEDLYREIRRLNCRSLVLLDACHSGTIVEDPVRQLTPDGVGPVILSACEPRETAAEDQVLGDQYTEGRADGVFTIALILALKREFPKADTNHDHVLTAAELNDYLRQRVASLLKAGEGPADGQHPTGSLPELEKNLPVAADAARR
jgi:WD40 repeat protein